MATQAKKPTKIPVRKLASQKKIIEKQKKSVPTEKKGKKLSTIKVK
jgi:hypothetical protein